MQDVFAQIDELYDLLMGELDNCRKAGCQLAENEAKYRMELSIAELHERERGTPVTIINDICRGDPRIADLRRARDCSKVLYEASREAVNVYKLRLRLLNEQASRVWFSGNTR